MYPYFKTTTKYITDWKIFRKEPKESIIWPHLIGKRQCLTSGRAEMLGMQADAIVVIKAMGGNTSY